MPVVRYIMKITATQGATPLGMVVGWSGQEPPEGWVECDGAIHRRKDNPGLATICRQYTPWWRWHILRQYRLPNIKAWFGKLP